MSRLQHRCFPVNFAKFLSIPFFTELHRWLLLDVNSLSANVSLLYLQKTLENREFADVLGGIEVKRRLKMIKTIRSIFRVL